MIIHLVLVLKNSICFVAKYGKLGMTNNGVIGIAWICCTHSFRKCGYFIFPMAGVACDRIVKSACSCIVITYYKFPAFDVLTCAIYKLLLTFSDCSGNW